MSLRTSASAPGGLPLVVAIACIGFAALAVASWLLAAAAHAGDADGVDHVAGTWLTLARSAGEGTLYPPLFDGESYGGTRYMPIPIVLHAGLGVVLGDYLVAGKLIAYLLMAALLTAVVVVVRRERCPLSVALLLASTLLVTGTGLTASTQIRHDTLPVVLQLAAVALVVGSTSRKALVLAGVLCALALAAKLSALWAPLAIGVWLLARERTRLPVFAASFLGFVALLLASFEAISSGRMTENVVTLGRAGSRGLESFDWEQNRIRFILADGLGPVRLVLVVALIVVLAAAWRRRVTLYALALACSLAILAVVLADRGAFSNQLLDVQVLSIVVVGAAWEDLRPLFRGGLVVLALVVGVGAYVENVEPVAAARALVDRDTSRLPDAARVLEPGAHVLSENPYVPVSLGQKPVVLDAFMLWSISRRHPDWRDALVRRLDAREFDAVVLFYRPEDRSRSDTVRYWYRTAHFGTVIVDAIERNYGAATPVGDLWIYRPRPRSR